MSKVCIIQSEKHPDRCICEVYGPFEDQPETHELAKQMEKDSPNFYYTVHTMESL